MGKMPKNQEKAVNDLNPKDPTDPLAATSSSTALCIFYRATELPVIGSLSPLYHTQEVEELVASGVFSIQLNARR